MVDTTTDLLHSSRTHRIPAPQPWIGTGVIDFGVARQHLVGTARFISMRKSRCGHTLAAWDKAKKQPRRRLGRSCQVALICGPQAWNTKPAYSRSVCDQNALVGGSSASFQDLALVAAGTRKAPLRNTSRKQARPAAIPRGAAKQKLTRTRSSDTLLGELQQFASEVINKDVSVDAPLMDAGLDSISATELSNKISAHLDTEFSPTLLFDHPSLRSIADALSVDQETE